MFYEQKVDRRGRKAMVDFLTNHPTHDGIISNNTKVWHLGLSSALQDKAWEVLGADYWHQISGPIRKFQEARHFHYTILSAGRSAGYLALYHSAMKSTEYQSYCRTCGQQNYRKAPPPLPNDPLERAVAQEVLNSGGIWTDVTYLGQTAIRELVHTDEEKLAVIRRLKPEWKQYSKDNRCGACGATGAEGRVNYQTSPMRLRVYNGVSVDLHDVENYEIDQLRTLVDLVVAFDRACDQIRDQFIALLQRCEVKEEIVMVPTTVHTLHCHC